MRILALFLPLLFVTPSCGSIPDAQLEMRSDPAGAEVYISRRGKRMVQAKAAFLKGSLGSKSYEEDFKLIGTTPLGYTSPLEEVKNDATLLGFGGKIILYYDEALLRFEKPGFQPLIRHVRLEEGTNKVLAEMIEEDAEVQSTVQASPD